MKDVIGIGALNLDLLYEVADLAALRKEGWPLHAGREQSLTPLEFRQLLQGLEHHGTLRFRSGGGSAANTIVALARMGFQTGFAGRVGADEEGRFILHEMRVEGVDVSQVKVRRTLADMIRRRKNRGRGGLPQVKAGEVSGICLVVLDSRRDRALVVQPNANDDLAFEDLNIPYLSDARYLHLSAFVGDGPFAAQKRLMEILPDRVKVSLDPGELYAQRGRKAILPLIERSSILFATEHEICILMDTKDYKAGCKEIASLGPDTVVCKRGEEGAYLFSRQEEAEFRPQGETKVVDNTGAGDVYNAGFLAGLLLKRPLTACLALAHDVAAKSLGGYGRQHYPDAADLKEVQEG
jgi:sugar/nucleoside kinase (ribokinase family)